MDLNIPSWNDPKAKRVYLIAGGAAAAYVGYRWWSARGGEPVAVDSYASGDSVVEGGGSGVPASGNVQYGGALIGADDGITTDSEWTSYVVDKLTEQGWEGTLVQGAIGRYLTDQSLTAEQETIVRAALAAAGRPPGGTHTIVTQDTTDEGPAPAPGPGKAAPAASPRNLRFKAKGPTFAVVTWDGVDGAEWYEVDYVTGAHKNAKTYIPAATFTGLKKGKRFEYRVRAANSAGAGPWTVTQYIVL